MIFDIPNMSKGSILVTVMFAFFVGVVIGTQSTRRDPIDAAIEDCARICESRMVKHVTLRSGATCNCRGSQ